MNNEETKVLENELHNQDETSFITADGVEVTVEENVELTGITEEETEEIEEVEEAE